MKAMNRIAVTVMTISFILASSSPARSGDSPIEIGVEVSPSSYPLGVEVPIALSFCNTTPETVMGLDGCGGGCFFDLLVENEAGDVVAWKGMAGPAVIVPITWDPYECKELHFFPWNQKEGYLLDEEGPQAPAGLYRAHLLFYSLPPLLEEWSEAFEIGAPAQEEDVRLAVDIAPGPAEPEPLDPRELVAFRGALFFVGESPLTGRELFRTDGIVEGTHVVADICSGRCSSDPEHLTVAGYHLFFRACDPARGCKIWSSDGSAEGTVAVADDPAWAPWLAGNRLAAWNDQVAFATEGGELFVSEGTVEGTRFVADVMTTDTAGTVYVAAGPSNIYVLLRRELWVSDGEGAERIAALPEGEGFFYGQPLAVGDRLFFGGPGGLWVSDGTAGGTRLVGTGAPSLRFALGDRAYFVLQENGLTTLHTSDGTAAGTQPVAGVPATESSYGFYDVVQQLGRSYFVRRERDRTPTRSGLWRLDENGTGAALVAEFDGSLSAVSTGASLYLATDRPNRLYRSFDPASSISLLGGWEDTESLSALTGIGEQMFFRLGADLATSNGRADGTNRLQLLWSAPSADPERLADHGGELLFSSGPLERGGVTDGTAGGTILVGEKTVTGVSAGGRAFFFDWPRFSSGLSVLEEDGWLTKLVDDAYFRSAYEHEGRFFFLAHGEAGVQLWASDGTLSGTETVRDGMAWTSYGCPDYCPEPPVEMTRLGERFYFPLQDVLWRSDGTTDGTEAVVSVSDLCASCEYLFFGDVVRMGERLYFFVADYLFQSDGSAAGTKLVAQIEAPLHAESRPIVAGDQMFFIVPGTGGGLVLWRSDGSPEGTRRVHEIRPRPPLAPWRAEELQAFGDRLYFVADDGVHGLELWSSDGSEEGTRLVADLRPGAEPSFPQGLAVAAGRLFFAADDGVHGLEPWTIDAPGAAPRLLADVVPGAGSSSARGFVRSGSYVYFNAGNAEAGFELWSVDLEQALFSDGFESGNTSLWSATTGAP